MKRVLIAGVLTSTSARADPFTHEASVYGGRGLTLNPDNAGATGSVLVGGAWRTRADRPVSVAVSIDVRRMTVDDRVPFGDHSTALDGTGIAVRSLVGLRAQAHLGNWTLFGQAGVGLEWQRSRYLFQYDDGMPVIRGKEGDAEFSAVLEPAVGALHRWGRVGIGCQVALALSTTTVMPTPVPEPPNGPKDVNFTVLSNFAF